MSCAHHRHVWSVVIKEARACRQSFSWYLAFSFDILRRGEQFWGVVQLRLFAWLPCFVNTVITPIDISLTVTSSFSEPYRYSELCNCECECVCECCVSVCEWVCVSVVWVCVWVVCEWVWVSVCVCECVCESECELVWVWVSVCECVSVVWACVCEWVSVCVLWVCVSERECEWVSVCVCVWVSVVCVCCVSVWVSECVCVVCVRVSVCECVSECVSECVWLWVCECVRVSGNFLENLWINLPISATVGYPNSVLQVSYRYYEDHRTRRSCEFGNDSKKVIIACMKILR